MQPESDAEKYFPVALISDNRHLIDGLSSFTAASVSLLGSVVQLVTSGTLGVWPEPPYVLWIDLPCTAVTQMVATKKVQETLLAAMQKASEQSCPIVMRRREFEGTGRSLEHWNKMRKVWNLSATKHCTCRYGITMGKMQPHLKYIAYSRDLLLHHSTCGTARLVDTIAKREYDRMDMRMSAKLISCWLCRDTHWAASGGRCVGDLEDESSGAQQLPDSLVADLRAAASVNVTCSGQQKVER